MNLYLRVAKLVKENRFSEALTEEWGVVRGCSYNEVIAQADLFVQHYLRARLIKALWLLFFIALVAFGFFYQPDLDWQLLSGLFLISCFLTALTAFSIFFPNPRQEAFVQFARDIQDLAVLLEWPVETVAEGSSSDLRHASEHLLKRLTLLLQYAVEEDTRDRENEDSDIDPLLSLESARMDYRQALEILNRFNLCSITVLRSRVGVA